MREVLPVRALAPADRAICRRPFHLAASQVTALLALGLLCSFLLCLPPPSMQHHLTHLYVHMVLLGGRRQSKVHQDREMCLQHDSHKTCMLRSLYVQYVTTRDVEPILLSVLPLSVLPLGGASKRCRRCECFLHVMQHSFNSVEPAAHRFWLGWLCLPPRRCLPASAATPSDCAASLGDLPIHTVLRVADYTCAS